MSTAHQLFRFATIGIASNAMLYLLYLALTDIGVGHKTAMTISFVIGVMCTYLLNRRWTFRHTGTLSRSAGRYVGIYTLAYAANLAALTLLVDIAHFSHQVVMLALIASTATLMFLLQKFWVFDFESASH